MMRLLILPSQEKKLNKRISFEKTEKYLWVNPGNRKTLCNYSHSINQIAYHYITTHNINLINSPKTSWKVKLFYGNSLWIDGNGNRLTVLCPVTSDEYVLFSYQTNETGKESKQWPSNYLILIKLFIAQLSHSEAKCWVALYLINRTMTHSIRTQRWHGT